jgi:dTDP-4-amino-4,6-dideoxygalactose transaminase
MDNTSPKPKNRFVIPVYKSKLPTVEQCFPYLKQIDNNRIYSNCGPLENLFRIRFKETFFPKISNEVISANNATSAMIQILRYWSSQEKSKKQYVICPSWTFVASAAAIINSNLVPVFIDSEYDSQLPAIKDLENKVIQINNLENSKVIAIIVTMPFGESIPVNKYAQFAKKNDMKLLIDAAAGLDALSTISSTNPSSFSEFTSVVSLHATKAFGIGEGAMIISQNQEDTKAITAFGNFGFSGSREAIYPGVNNKLPEYMAAVGLAMIDNIDLEKEEWINKRKKFIELLQSKAYIKDTSKNFFDDINPYGNVRLDLNYFNGQSVEFKLEQKGIETRNWWGAGVHNQSYYRFYINHYETYSSQYFINTERIASETIGLPFFRDITEENLEYIFSQVDELQC